MFLNPNADVVDYGTLRISIGKFSRVMQQSGISPNVTNSESHSYQVDLNFSRVLVFYYFVLIENKETKGTRVVWDTFYAGETISQKSR